MRKVIDPRVDSSVSFVWHNHVRKRPWSSSVGDVKSISFEKGRIAIKVHMTREEAEKDPTYDKIRDLFLLDIKNSDGRVILSEVAELKGRDEFTATLGLREST